MQNLIALIAAVITFSLSIVAAGTSLAVERPNVVVLLADDLGFRDLGSYDGPVSTPTLDELAAKGIRFTNFYSGCAVCSPSRATLLTGRHHIRTGVYSWIHDASQASHLLEREITIAELLHDVGYATAHIGKWHLGLPTASRKKPTPSDHGFDYWLATWNNAEPSHRNPRNFIRNGESLGELEGYACQIVADEAIQWLKEHREKDRPFFLNVWFHEPHQRIAAPDHLVKKYGQLKDQSAIYSATIENTDLAIQRILEAVYQIDKPENTLVIYASDNGSYREDRTGGLRGRKGANWEGGIRVPGIFVWPGKIQRGVSDVPAGLVDVLPTLCGLLQIPPPQRHLDGSNVAPLLTGTGDFQRHQPLFWHLQRSRPIVALRDGDYSLIAERDYDLPTDNMFREAWIPAIKGGGYKNYQLFNLRTDPQQQKNLADQEPEQLMRLRQKLLAISRSVLADGADWHLKP